jgi:hypothetical protein
MLNNLLQERCEIAFVQYVADVLASEPDCCGQASADVPWGRGWGFTKAGIPHLIRDIRAALDAKVWFNECGPDWAKPLPMGRECAALFQARGALHLLGRYAFSLQMADFDYLKHPQPFDYFCGVMAHPNAPDHVRDDPELQAEFPAKVLPGLCSRLIWSGESLRAQPRAGLLGH